jgi:serine/threonine protein kinase
LFKFIFHLYGFVRSMKALRQLVSMDFDRLVFSLETQHKQMPTLPRRGRDKSAASSKPQSNNPPLFPTLNGLSWALKARGYDWSEEPHQWPKKLAKVTKNGLKFAAKVVRPNEGTILKTLEWHHRPKNRDNYVVKLVDVISCSGGFDVILMPWLSPLGTLGDCVQDVGSLLICQFLEGVSFLHGSRIAHLDLKPENVLVDRTGKEPRLSIIDFGMSILVEDTETTVTGFRGTPSWTAPEIGVDDGPMMTYSAILADRWSCGRMLQHISNIYPTSTDALFQSVCAQLVNSDPRMRLSPDKALQKIQPRKSQSSGVEGLGRVQKRTRRLKPGL